MFPSDTRSSPSLIIESNRFHHLHAVEVPKRQFEPHIQCFFEHLELVQFLGQLRDLFGLLGQSLHVVPGAAVLLKGIVYIHVQKGLAGVASLLE